MPFRLARSATRRCGPGTRLAGFLKGRLPPPKTDALEPSIYRFILRYSRRDQLYLVIVTLLSFPFLYLSLDLPKLIINGAIGGKHFPRVVLGIPLGQLPYLVLLCAVFLLLVLINGGFKYHLNVRKGRVGERMLRRLRYELFQRVLRFPLHRFDRTASGQIIAMLTAELEPVGGFIGDALALPIAQAGTLLTIFVFMFVQNPALGAAAISLYPIQAYFIPKMQRRIRELGRERVRKVRTLSDRIAEDIAARVEIRTNAAAPHQLAQVSSRLGEIYDIRFDIYNRKFFVKFLNNFINQLIPFFFYLLGGYLVIIGDLSFGALVAVLAAYKDLSSPWRELLDFYQNQQDVAIKYEQVVEQFQAADLVDRDLLLGEASEQRPTGELKFTGVGLVDADGIRLLDTVSFALPLGADAALVGPGNSGRNLVPQLLARLSLPTSGRITIGGADLATMPFAASNRLIGYAGPTTSLFSGSIRDNLLVGLRYRPHATGAADHAQRARDVDEARRSGNSEHDTAADWIDYAQAGAGDAAALEGRIVEVLRLVELADEVYLFGLHGRLDPERHPDAAARLLEARRRFAERHAALGLARFVERFDPQRYSRNASIADNLLFGTPVGPVFADGSLVENGYVQAVLQQAGIDRDLLGIGLQLAQTMVELFGSLTVEPQLVEDFGFVRGDELHGLDRLQARAKRNGPENLPPADRARLLELALQLVAARDRLGLIDDALQARIVAARHRFAGDLPESLRDAIEFFDPERYDAAARVEQNILFGAVVGGEAEAYERVRRAIAEVLDELGLRDTVLAIGLDHPVGTGGMRLSPAQRQKIAIARAVLKRPVVLALDEATAVLDPAAEGRILAALRRELADGRSLVAALSRPEAARGFDRVLVMERGRLTGDGSYAEATRADGPLATMLAAE
ncbi:MAG TPA: ABC transporter transmembrane domain-containing protein [Stellaceae bacterium]|nr:ABC transporter transmembrane domain-containing protein [Stellaceae bacterium]